METNDELLEVLKEIKKTLSRKNNNNPYDDSVDSYTKSKNKLFNKSDIGKRKSIKELDQSRKKDLEKIKKIEEDIAEIRKNSKLTEEEKENKITALNRSKEHYTENVNEKNESIANSFTGIVNKISGMIVNIVQTAGTIIQSEIQKEVNDIQAKYDSANVTLEKNLQKLTNSINLGGSTLSTAFNTSAQILTGSIEQGASSAVDGMASTMIEAGKVERQKDLLEFQKLNKLEIFEKSKQVKNQAETNKQWEAGLKGLSSITTDIASLIPGVGTLAGAAAGAVTGIVNNIASTTMAISLAKNEAELKSLELQLDLQEKQKEAANKVIDTIYDNAEKMLKTAKGLVEPTVKAAKEYDTAFRKTAIDIGLAGGEISNYVRKQIKEGQNLVLDANKNIFLDWSNEQRAKFQQAYSDKTGYSVELTLDDQKMAGAMSQIWDENIVNDIASAMQLYNQSVEDSSDLMYEMYQLAAKTGLSQSKYSKDLTKNLKLAERYQFKGGVKSLMEMTAWAQKIRFNMDNLGSMLNKIQEGGLEGIIENTAKLQVLGGNFAMGADPLATLYEAYNSPEDLGKRYEGMTRGMGYFDENIGDVRFGAQDQMQLQSMAAVTGTSVEDLMNMRRATLKRGKLEGLLKNTNYTKDEKELIYSKALYDKDKNEWTVNGKGLNELQKSDFASLKDIDQGIFSAVAHIESMMAKTRGADNRNSNKNVSEHFELIEQNNQNLINEAIDFADKSSGKFDGLFSLYFKYQENALKNQNEATLDNISIIEKGIELMTELSTKKTIEEGFHSMDAGFKALLSKDSEMLRMYLNNQGIETKLDVDKLSDIEVNNYKENPRMRNGLSDEEKDKLYKRDTRDFWDKFLDFFTKTNSNNEKWKSDKNDTTYIQSQQYPKSNISLQSQMMDNMYTAMDFVSSTDNTPMFTTASKVTPIEDGSVQLVKSDPKDTAIFAKEGGPFDTLFNGIFAKINEISKVLPRAMEYPMPIDIHKHFNNEGLGNSKFTTNNNNIQINPVKIELNGKLELTSSNGQSVDIINELRTNPMLIRQLSQLLAESLNENIYGGKSIYNGGVVTSRFNKL